MSAPPPDDPSAPQLPPPEEHPQGRSGASVVLGIVVGLAAVLGAWTLVIGGICFGLGSSIGG